VVGLIAQAAAPSGERRLVAASLALVIALAWLYLWQSGAAMDDMAAMPHMGGVSAFALTFAMWAVMMTGMMLPSAAPAIMLYAALVRKNAERGSALPAAWIFTSGYLAAWTAFSAAAALAQSLLEHAMLMTSTMSVASKGVSGALLLAAGIYQWLPAKEICLRKCRNPLELFTVRWRPGALGAFRMGLEHGLYCVGCCWMLMLLLFAAGVMNLLWVALIAAVIFAEKLLPGARYTSAVAGLALLGTGLFFLL
jgi:predicted metal-binding membrane protein